MEFMERLQLSVISRRDLSLTGPFPLVTSGYLFRPLVESVQFGFPSSSSSPKLPRFYDKLDPRDAIGDQAQRFHDRETDQSPPKPEGRRLRSLNDPQLPVTTGRYRDF
jgi:hypothetical protein